MEAGGEWCAAAGTVRHYALQWTGYTRRGKAEEGIGQDDSEIMCNVRCMGYSDICRVWVTSVRVWSGQIVHEQQSVRKKDNTTITMSDKELGTAR